ncbi:methyl-accepting chemotaxis sensory transducer with GAF sensor [Stanieria cyanosphaera PCC 7437]|uniref:Methyl-accepting chemotaxis sensory transducer with GAF sensor n=1 Tax=Stanieria cyanosphaera (strain ATCC 29371 / PCC 7437) TaxID=111780 RepID=K9Y1M0_STAC7|nr:methyl-accepting chemotaxis protein [Stanieria cyanosphaera]AFZ37887.1 methyl-accepting chemotaxis sensory transducer with GAF sensor [Stanieria cyanosphaera PCC 7437]
MTQIPPRFNNEVDSLFSNSINYSKYSQVKKNYHAWLKQFYNLSINRKTSLIPWLSFAALALVLGIGTIILRQSLQAQLFQQAQLGTKTIEALIPEDFVNGKSQIVKNVVGAFNDNDTYSAIYLRQSTGEFILASSLTKTNQSLIAENLLLNRVSKQPKQILTQIGKVNNQKYALAAKAITNFKGEIVGVIVYGSSTNEINSILWRSILIQLILALIVIILLLLFTRILASAIAIPIQQLQQVTQDFSEGNLKARATVGTTDEIGLLASTFNILADSIETNEEKLRQEAQSSRILKEIAVRIAQVFQLKEIFQIAVTESQVALAADRVIYYQFDDDWQGKVVAEAVAAGYPEIKGSGLNDPCFAEQYAQQYQNGRIQTIANLDQADLSDCYLQMLAPFAVRAVMTVGVVTGEKLIGLLIAHQCAEPRTWQEQDIDLLVQVASQISNAFERVKLLQQQQIAQDRERKAKEELQQRALELLMEVDPVSRGDLTIRAQVKEDEIGTIADSYNATIESLRKLVTKVKTAAQQVATTTSTKEIFIQELSAGASAQTKEINTALERIKTMTASIQAVAANAEAAEAAVRQATATVETGDQIMNRTVDGFVAIRETVAETAKKVKRLGESSQKISKVVNLIGNFADQTNLLALNASIEAAHAGEEGRGFAVVAEEVRSLARQSAEATAEIETLVAAIQAETNEVVAAMEAGTEQVVTGTKLIDETRMSLNQITTVSHQINQLVNAIAQATIEQSKDSEVVSQTMSQVATVSEQTEIEAIQVSNLFKELLTVAQELQESVSKFKVN